MSSACTCHINPDNCSWCKLHDIKNRIIKEENGWNNYMNVSIEEMDWLVQQAEKVERYEKALFNTYIDGMTIDEILEAADEFVANDKKRIEKC